MKVQKGLTFKTNPNLGKAILVPSQAHLCNTNTLQRFVTEIQRFVECNFVLEMDASYTGLGAVLSQQQDDGKVDPIAYASRSLHEHGKNYGVT